MRSRGGSLRGKALLMLFVSHTCPICKKIIPSADFTKRRLEVLYVGDARGEQKS